MKTFLTLALTLVLTAGALVGCGCTNRNIDNTSAPTVLPTNEEIWDTTEATRATTESTRPPMTTEDSRVPMTTDNTVTTTGETTDGTAGTDGTTATEGPLERSARRMMPNMR